MRPKLKLTHYRVRLAPFSAAAQLGKKSNGFLAFFSLFILPILCAFGAASDHVECSKQTTFCLSCHVMEPYGGIRAKLRGLRHIYIQYLGTPPPPNQIKLYSPYDNRECLHCHLVARSFESNAVHMAIMDSLKSNDMSCVTSGCHDTVHNIDSLSKVKFWSPVQ